MSRDQRAPQRDNQDRPPAKKTSANRKLTFILLAVAALVVGAGFIYASTNSASKDVTTPPTTPSPNREGTVAEDKRVVRESSHRLSEAKDGKVTFVEFLDFECEACGSVYPAIEELRAQYDGRVTFVARYFPLEGHFNAMRAARAVEAAAQQGQFEAMYKRMYETQTEWAEQQTPKDDVFRGYAKDLGLDLTQWDTDYNSQATQDRIQADIDDGIALGVQSTPTFFLNGQPFSPQSTDDITQAFDQALNE